MINRKQKRIDPSALIPPMLLALFGIFLVTVLLFGVRGYRERIRQDREDYERRTVLLYLTTRFRQSDGEIVWRIGDFNQNADSAMGDTLFLYETIGSKLYCTRIYCHEGYLYELFTAVDETIFFPEDGEKLLPAPKLLFQREENGLLAKLMWEDEQKELYLFQRSTEGESV